MSLNSKQTAFNGLKQAVLTPVVSRQQRWWLIHNECPCLLLTITSIRSASLTCPSAVCPLTHSSPRLAPEKSKACDSRLACRHSMHSQTVNPMIQAGTRLSSAPVSSLLYTLGSANGEQMQGNRRLCQLHTDKQPTTSLCCAPTSGLWSCRNMSDILRGLGLKKERKGKKKKRKKTPTLPSYPDPSGSMKAIFHLKLQCKSFQSVRVKKHQRREETCVVRLLYITHKKVVVWRNPASWSKFVSQLCRHLSLVALSGHICPVTVYKVP